MSDCPKYIRSGLLHLKMMDWLVQVLFQGAFMSGYFDEGLIF